MCYLVRKILILIACIFMILFISACKHKAESPDNIEPLLIHEITTNDYLVALRGKALKYFGLPDEGLRIGYGELNRNPHPDGLIWGTFFGVIPVEESYIALDNVLKMESHYTRVYVIGHEVCHYNQWRNGVKFDQTNLKWNERWYEIECIEKGNMFLWEMIREEHLKYEDL